MQDEYDVLVVKILKDMEKERYKLSHPFVGSEHLLLSLLKNDNEIKKIFFEFNVTYNNFKDELINVVGIPKKNVEFNLYTPLLKRVINFAKEEAALSEAKVTGKYLLESLLEENEGVAIKILLKLDVDLDVLYKNLNKKDISEEVVCSFGKNLNYSVNMDEVVVGREKEINFIIETLLRKKKSNPLLIGEAGVGKTAVVEEVARRINLGLVPRKLVNANIISLDMSSVVSGTKYRGEFEEKLNKIIESSEKNENIILFIDEVHTIVNAGGAEGAIGAGDILKPCMARGNIKIIGATTTHEYNKYILKDKALSRRFENVNILEPGLSQTIDILNIVKSEYEKFHGVTISKRNVLDIIKYSDKYIFDKKNPDKAIDFMDSVASYVQIKNDQNLSNKTLLEELNVIKIQKEELVKKGNYKSALELFEKEKSLESKIDNINNPVNYKITHFDILSVLKAKINLPFLSTKKEFIKNVNSSLKKVTSKNDNNVLTNFLASKLEDLSLIKSCELIGKSDDVIRCVEKSLSNLNIIRVCGDDFISSESVNKLKGAPAGYSGYGDEHIFSSLRQKPFALIIVENYDQMSGNVKSLFKGILKNGFLLDSKMEKINFNNSIMLFTKKEDLKNKVGFNNDNKLGDNKSEVFDLTLRLEEFSLINV